MKTRVLIISIVLIVFSFTSTIKSQVKVDSLDILEYGIYTSETSEEMEAEGTARGAWKSVYKIRLIARTDSIPANVGTHFGFWFVVQGEPKGKEISVLFVNRLPGLKNPSQDAVVREEKYTSTVKLGEPSFKGYLFEYEWEAVPGEWIFEIHFEDKKLSEQKFFVK